MCSIAAMAGRRCFTEKEDYIAFLDVMVQAGERLPMRLLAWCLLPNHFHLVLWPRGDEDLSRWMQSMLTSHVRRDGSEPWQHAIAERLGPRSKLPAARPPSDSSNKVECPLCALKHGEETGSDFRTAFDCDERRGFLRPFAEVVAVGQQRRSFGRFS